jgi:ATP-dependent Clp protease adapter protein ClpS
VIRHECGKKLFVITTNGTYPWSFVTVIFQHAGAPGMHLYTNGKFTTRKFVTRVTQRVVHMEQELTTLPEFFLGF